MSSVPRVGTEIAGYRIEALLARGGMSTVYIAEHLRLGRKVALKILASELREDESFRSRFVRESRIAAGLDHPNIIPIYEAGEADGALFIAMRYVQGPNLKDLVRQLGPLPANRITHIIGQVAGALDAAHALGLVHRDVKPGNVLIDPEVQPEHMDHVYLCDFGLTKQTSSHSGLTRTGQFVGTIDYIAPEQVEGKDVDARTDLYSLGCVLYECLTGTVPFQKNAEAAVLWAHVQEEPMRVSDTRPDFSPAIDDVILTAMAKQPDDRYQTGADLVAGLRAAVAMPPKGATAPSVAPETVIDLQEHHEREPDRLYDPMPSEPPLLPLAPLREGSMAPSEQVSPRSAASEPSSPATRRSDEVPSSPVPRRGKARRRRPPRTGLALTLILGLVVGAVGASAAWQLTRPPGEIFDKVLQEHIPEGIFSTCSESHPEEVPSIFSQGGGATAQSGAEMDGEGSMSGQFHAFDILSSAECGPVSIGAQNINSVTYMLIHNRTWMSCAFKTVYNTAAVSDLQPNDDVERRLRLSCPEAETQVPDELADGTPYTELQAGGGFSEQTQGSCAEGSAAANPWVLEGAAGHEELSSAVIERAGGLVLCYKTDQGYVMVWTDNVTNLLNVAEDNNLQTLGQFWRDEAGPKLE